MLQKLRRAMVRPERDRLSGTVELDETYIGGVEEGRRGGRQRDSKKSILAGAVEVRGHGSGRLSQAGDKWHLDEVVITIAGKKHWLWRAVDQDGFVLDVLVQSRGNQQAAERLLRKLLKRQGRPPRVLITDKLASYPAAKKVLMPGVENCGHEGLNNRAENSHQPTRRRERQMKRFKSAGQAQRFLSAHDQINNFFYLRRDHVTATQYRTARAEAGVIWAEVTGAKAAA